MSQNYTIVSHAKSYLKKTPVVLHKSNSSINNQWRLSIDILSLDQKVRFPLIRDALLKKEIITQAQINKAEEKNRQFAYSSHYFNSKHKAYLAVKKSLEDNKIKCPNEEYFLFNYYKIKGLDSYIIRKYIQSSDATLWGVYLTKDLYGHPLYDKYAQYLNNVPFSTRREAIENLLSFVKCYDTEKEYEF